MIAAGPAITAWQGSGGDFNQFGKNVAYNYVGWDGKQIQTSQTFAGIGQVVLGIVVAKLFKLAARHF